MQMGELPPEIRKLLESTPVDLPVPPGSRVVDSVQMQTDLDYKVGDRQGLERVAVDNRQDPLEELEKPIDQYDRQFFFPGLVHGYCRIGAPLTERYRAAENQSLDSWLHRVEHPLVSLPGVSGFEETQLVRTLQSVAADRAGVFWQFLQSQLLVDRKRGAVWKIDVREVQVLDPYLVDKKQQPPYAVNLRILCPKTYMGSYQIRPQKGGFVGQPVVDFVRLHNPEFEKVTKEVLGDGR